MPPRINSTINACAIPATRRTSSTLVHARGSNVIRVTIGTKIQPKLAMPARAESGRALLRDENDHRQNDNATNALTTLKLRAKPPQLSSRASASCDHASVPKRINTRLMTRSAKAAIPAIHAKGGVAAK